MAYSQYKHGKIYELAEGFLYFDKISLDQQPDKYLKGEKFKYDAFAEMFVALDDGAMISAAVAAKHGKQAKKKMFIESK